MSDQTQSTVGEDLAYVRRALERSGDWRSPASIYFLWAAIVLVGFTLVDFAREVVTAYWVVAAPVGFVASAWLGYRAGRRSGQEDRAAGVRITLHWLALLVGCSLVGLAVPAGSLTWRGLGAMIVLLSAVVYYLAGLHGEPRMLWISGVLAAGYVAVLFVPGAVWTAVGALVALAMVAAGVASRSRGPRHAAA